MAGVTNYENDFEEHLLINLHELLVPFLDVCGLLARVGVVIVGRWRIVLVMLAPFNHLFKDGGIDIRNGNRLS